MLQSLKMILDIQDLDMKMIRLMRMKRERNKELEQIDSLRSELNAQIAEKQKEIEELASTASTMELKIQEINAKLKRLESQQSSVKKVDEFNALTQELTQLERERVSLEQKVLDHVDKKLAEEELLDKIRVSLKDSEQSSMILQDEIRSSLQMINEEGSSLLKRREALSKEADPVTLEVYERLLHNKKDRVIVPIENRTCSGCHITITAQHENVVRKSENLVFCEHCSRVHYWPQSEELATADDVAVKRRRRRTPAAT